MNRKILEIPLYLKTLIRTLATCVLIGFGITKLPIEVLILSIAVTAFGAFTIVMGSAKKPAVKYYNRYFAVDLVAVLFTLVYMALFTSVSVTVFDMLIAGSLLDIVLNSALLIYGIKQHRYALIENKVPAQKKVSVKKETVKLPKLKGIEELNLR